MKSVTPQSSSFSKKIRLNLPIVSSNPQVPIIPAKCGKVALILPVGKNDLKRVGADIRVIAVELPNVNGPQTGKGGHGDFLTTTDAIEVKTGLDFWLRVPVEVQEVEVREVIESRVDSGHAKLTKVGEDTIYD